MKNRVLVLARSKKSRGSLRFVEEANAAGLDLDVVEYRDIRFEYRGRELAIGACESERDILEYTHFICRGSTGFHQIKNAVLTAVIDKRFVLNREAYCRNIGYYNKLVQLVRLADAGLPMIPTRLSPSEAEFHAFVADTLEGGSSVFLKRVAGSHGDGAALVESLNDLQQWPDLDPGLTFVQDYMPAEFDYRILVLGDRSLGVMRRTKTEGSIVSNVAKGGKITSASLSHQVHEIASDAARVMGIEFAAVDLLMHDGSPYIMEVNVMPQFSGFEAATGVNVAGTLLQYILDR